MNPKPRTWWQYLIPLLFLGLFFFLPLVFIFLKAIQSASPGWITSASQITRPLGFTFFQAILSLLLTLLVGIPAAYIFSHYQFRGSTTLQVIVMLPFILPTVIVAAGFNALVGPNGWLNLLLVSMFKLSTPPIHFLGTFGAILIAHVFYNTTIVVRVMGGAWRELNQKYEQAGKVLGANPSQLFREVTLPLLMPALLSASLLVFIFDFTSFGVILLLGGPAFSTLETEIYTQSTVLLNLPLAGILSIIQLACTLGMTILVTQISGRSGFNAIARVISNTTSKVKGFLNRTLVYVYSILLFLFFGSPIVSLFLRSILSQRNVQGSTISPFTLAYYQELFINRQNSIFYVPPISAILNSLLFALATTVIAILMGLFSTYALNRRNKVTRFLDPILMLPLGVSAVTLGLGFVVSFGQLPQALSIFPFLIPVVHSLVAFPFVVRILQPALSSIPVSLHSAAASLGASSRKIFWQVDLPLLRRPLIIAALFAFAISLGEFGATIFLARPEYPTIPVAIYRFLAQPGALNYGEAMAMATILMVLCAVCILGMELLGSKRSEMAA
jgi:thiamine transport system permease protein